MVDAHPPVRQAIPLAPPEVNPRESHQSLRPQPPVRQGPPLAPPEVNPRESHQSLRPQAAREEEGQRQVNASTQTTIFEPCSLPNLSNNQSTSFVRTTSCRGSKVRKLINQLQQPPSFPPPPFFPPPPPPPPPPKDQKSHIEMKKRTKKEIIV